MWTRSDSWIGADRVMVMLGTNWSAPTGDFAIGSLTTFFGAEKMPKMRLRMPFSRSTALFRPSEVNRPFAPGFTELSSIAAEQRCADQVPLPKLRTRKGTASRNLWSNPTWTGWRRRMPSTGRLTNYQKNSGPSLSLGKWRVLPTLRSVRPWAFPSERWSPASIGQGRLSETFLKGFSEMGGIGI